VHVYLHGVQLKNRNKLYVTQTHWGHISPTLPSRFKGLNFEEAGMGFELPKQLAVSDIAVRILHTHYDHLSVLARITHLGTHTPCHRSDSFLSHTEMAFRNRIRLTVYSQVSCRGHDSSGRC